MNSADFRIIFASSDKIALKTLSAVHNNFNIVGILTSKEGQEGRKKAKNEILSFANDNNIPFITPEHLKSDEREWVKKQKANFLLSFSYSKIFGPMFLDLFTLGTLNIHPSLLPLYRGPSPLQSAILNNDKKTGISFQKIALKMDEGDIYKAIEFDIKENDDIITLREKASLLSSTYISEVLQFSHKEAKKQNGNASYTSLFSKDDGRINFNTDTANNIACKIKAFLLFPRTFCFYNEKKLFLEKCLVSYDTSINNIEFGRVLAFDKTDGSFIINAKDNQLKVYALGIEGKNIQSAKDFKNGHRDFVGSLLK